MESIRNFNISLFQLKYFFFTKPTHILPYKCDKFLVATCIATAILSQSYNAFQSEKNKTNAINNTSIYAMTSMSTLAVGHLFFKFITPFISMRIESARQALQKIKNVRV